MKRRLLDNLRRVQDRIASAAQRSGRDPDTVTLVAVTKTVELDVIRQLLDLGVRDIGESRVLELAKRAGMIHEHLQRRVAWASQPPAEHGARPRWHMIGHLQRNKVRAVLPWTDLIHSLDSLRLAEAISAHAEKLARPANVLMEINATGEKTKFGVAVGAATHLAEQIVTLPALNLLGLMAMAPLLQDPEKTRPVFQRTRELFEEMCGEKIVGPDFVHLSMGMSNDYPVAIEEGATMVRIGTALFEGLPAHAPVEQ
jgi:pyridoxal phosphate enzyme (YggS family)